MMKEEKCCGTCKYNGYMREYGDHGDYGCTWLGSDAYGLPTQYNDVCEEWEEKKQ